VEKPEVQMIKGMPRNEYIKEYRQRPEVKKREKERQKRYNQKNKEKILKRRREHYRENKDEMRAKQREYTKRPEVRAKRNEGHKKYYHAHKAEIIAKETERRRRLAEIHNLGKPGDPDTIREMCVDFGISEEIADAIAMDGVVLDNKMKEIGLV